MRKRRSRDEDLKDGYRDNEVSGDNESGASSDTDGSGAAEDGRQEDDHNQSDGGNDRYAYTDGEFNPDEWEDRRSSGRRGPVMQKGLGLFVSIIAIILFAALFIVEFRSYTKVKSPADVYDYPDNSDEKEVDNQSILEIIETGTNYTIYLDNDTGIEYVMFKVGSSISIQPLINPDGSYKQYVEPETLPDGSVKETATRHTWRDNFKLPGGDKETSSEQPASQDATKVTRPAAATGASDTASSSAQALSGDTQYAP